VLYWLEQTALQSDGDISFDGKKVVFDWHKNFYLYTNSWIAIGAQRCGHFNFARKLIGYILKYQNSETGAFRSRLIKESKDELCDSTITGNCGIACLFTGNMEAAFSAADALCRLVSLQDRGSIFYTSMDSKGNVWKNIPEEHSEYFQVDQSQDGQLYWYIGISAAHLLHSYSFKQDRNYLDNAIECLNFLAGCRNDVLRSFASGKYAYALALAFRYTGIEDYRIKALDYCGWLADIQHADGSWDNEENNLEWFLKWDLTAEMAYWIREVHAIV
jgi:hypothetical protein